MREITTDSPCPRCKHPLIEHYTHCVPHIRRRDESGWLRTEWGTCECPFSFVEAMANAQDRADEPVLP